MPVKKKTEKKKVSVKKPVKKTTVSEKKKVVAQPKKKVVPVSKTTKMPALLRGMKDILPKDAKMWQKLFHTAENISGAYGYGMLETPVMEEASLFIRSIGRGTDVVDKEMYVFEDRDGTKIGLRPEGTASAVRSYISQGMHNLPQPVKVWYYGPMFRHDRPQAGRFRQFHQFGAEVFGDREPVMDAELISISYNFLRDLGVESQVHINSIGNAEDRERYTVELLGYLRSKRSYLPEEIRKRMVKNPLRVLDSKLEEMKPIIEEAPQIIDWLSENSKKYFMQVLEYLDEMDVPYVLDSTLVRGLDYYTDTVFELFEESTEEASQNALGGGGRYDKLVEKMGGRETPAAGFGIGLERVVAVMRRNQEKQGGLEEETGGVFFAQLGEQARRRALVIIEQLRREGLTVKHNLGKTSLKAQLEIANKYKVGYAIILGQKEVQDGTIIIRDMESGIQEIIDQKRLNMRLEKMLGKA